jgi:hypothetical protein
MGWVETKRWQDFRNPGSQGMGCLLLYHVPLHAALCCMCNKRIQWQNATLAHRLQVMAASLASLMGSRARATATPVRD